MSIILLLSVFFIRVIPVYLICSRGIATAVDADPLFYLSGAREILKTGTNPYNFFPPLNFLFIAVCLWFGGGSIAVPLGAIAVLGWLTVGVLYLLTSELWGRREALLTVLISGLYPNFIYYGVNFYPETLALFFIVVSFFMLVRYRNTADVRYLLMSGCTWGLASQTRGGLHFFSLVIALMMVVSWHKPRGMSFLKPAIFYLLSVYTTIIALGLAVSPIQGEFSLNAKSGIASAVHGANRITTPCTDYGDIRGNIFYEINNYGEQWPEGSQLYSEAIWRLSTGQILLNVLSFVSQDPLTYLRYSMKKLSCLWSPNQMVIKWLKIQYHHKYSVLIQGICLGISVLYMVALCGGIWGIVLAADSCRRIVIIFIIFYCVLVFLTVGNSKLRLPLMPFVTVYCAYFISRVVSGTVPWKRMGGRLGVMLILILFIGNGIYKYQEIILSPDEVRVRQIELLSELGFPETALYLLKKYAHFSSYTKCQRNRMNVVERNVRSQVQPQNDDRE